jgi:N-acetylglucosamine-6-sulfatase
MRHALALTLTAAALLLTAIGAGAKTLQATTLDPAPAGTLTAPNIVVVLTDDEPALDGRLTDLMPTLHALEAESVVFDEFHPPAPLCCPARATLLTGRYPHKTGVVENDYRLFDPSRTVATELQARGYYTFLAGKYLNYFGDCDVGPCPPPFPPGWDRFRTIVGQRFYDWIDWDSQTGRSTGHGIAPQDYSTDVVAAWADEMIRQAPMNRPLFGWVAPVAPHEPITPAPRHTNASCPAGQWTPPSYNAPADANDPKYVQDEPPNRRPADLRRICRTLLSIDDLVATVRQALVATGRWANTCLVYMGDNGMAMGEHKFDKKSVPYSTRVPAVWRCPSQRWTPHTVSERVSGVDFAATVCELTGCSLSGDGTSLVPLLQGTGSLGRTSWLSELPAGHDNIPGWFAVTTDGLPAAPGKWHYVEYPTTGERELYDVTGGPCWTWKSGSPGDPCELTNLAYEPRYAATVTVLAAELTRLRNE